MPADLWACGIFPQIFNPPKLSVVRGRQRSSFSSSGSMFPPVDTKDSPAVAAFVEAKFAAMYPGASLQWLRTLFTDMERLFSGKHPDYGEVDIRYHDFEHTLQATLC